MSDRVRLLWREKGDLLILCACLVMGFFHGVIYVFLVLPWQHYDEPNHFEYAWLTAHQPGLPTEKSNDPEFNRAVVKSMIDHRFFEIAGLPNPTFDDANLRMPFYSQKSDPPVYYLVASLPLRVLRDRSVETQLYAARFVSLGFFLLTVLFCWGAVRDVTPRGHRLRWMVPVSVVLLPSLVDIHTAVNNDAAGIAMFTLFLWGSVRWLRERSWLNLLWVINAAVTCALVRSITMLALPFAAVVLVFGFVAKGSRRYLWLGGAVMVMVGIALSFRWGEPRFWYHQSGLDEGAAVESGQAIDGRRVFKIVPQEGRTRLVQVLANEDTFQKTYTTMTLAGWMWADEAVTVQTPMVHLRTAEKDYGAEMELTTTPKFFSITFTPEGSLYRGWVSFELPAGMDYRGAIYLDQLILVEGEYGGNDVKAVEEGKRVVEWDGQRLRNLIRNGSAEELTFAPRLWFERLASTVLPDKGYNSITLLTYSVMDTAALGKYYRNVFLQMFRTFWAKFGWGGLALVGGTPYRYVGYFCVLSLIGCVGMVGMYWKKAPWTEMMLFGLMVFVMVFLALTRGANYVLWKKDYFPVARYIYPVVGVILFGLNLGWSWWIERLKVIRKVPVVTWYLLYLFLWLYLDYRAIQTLWLFRYGS